MNKYKIHIDLITKECHKYKADNFVVVDSKLEIFLLGSIISYDFDLIENILIKKQEDEKVNRIHDDIRRGF